MSAGATPSSSALPTRSPRWLAAALLVAGILAYANSFSGRMVADDGVTIARSPYAHGATLSTVLFPGRESPIAGRPLASASFALNYALGGVNLSGYHAVNLILHLACALLLFGIVRRTLRLRRVHDRFGTRADALAFAVALLWVVHPLNTEVVDYLTQRTESMMALCYLGTLYATVRAAEGHHEGAWLTASVFACVLGAMSKESIATAPVVILVFESTFVFGSFAETLRRRRFYYMGLVASWAVLAVLVSTGARRYSAGFTSGASPLLYVLNQAEMIVRYMYLSVWPRALVLVYGPMPPVGWREVAPFAIFVLATLGLTIVTLVKTPRVGFLGLWFFATLAPTSSVVPIWTEVGAERRMYLPLAGLIALTVVAFAAACDRWGGARSQRVGAALVASLAVALGVRTVLRNRDYADPLTMARTVLARWPTPTAHAMMGTALAAAGDHVAAISELRAAAPAYPPARYYLGGELFNAGRLDEAIAELQQFTALAPLSLDLPNAEAMIGQAQMLQRNWPAAIQHLSRAVALDPSDRVARAYIVDALSNQGIALAASNRTEEAIVVFRQAVATDPYNGRARRNLVRALLNAGRAAAALTEARRAVADAPDDAASRDLLGRALATNGDVDSAAREFERALAIDPANRDAADDLRVVRPTRVLPPQE